MAAIEGVITVIGRKKLCEAHAGKRTLPKISGMAWGDGGTDGDGTPKTVTGQEKSMYNQLLKKDEHTTAVYSATLESGDLVGKYISELALFDEEGDMIAYQTFLKKGKDEGMPQRYDMEEIF